ncbi:AgmX/PglI C-terminal domain-containing protein [Myxococcota bacterium]|nr:AgmX/PglI C-terminal domain-containing protein [Myxococcota bacterium]
MSLRSATVKVLRIGLIQDGVLVSERVLAPGEAYATPQTLCPGPDRPLFVPDAEGRVTLTLPPGCTARVMRGAEALTLRTGERLVLEEQDRGKLSFEQGTLLFQLVLPALTNIDTRAFRPRLLDVEDSSYYGFLSVFSAAALAFSVVVSVTPPRTATITMDDLPRAVTEVMLAVPPPPEPVEAKPVLTDRGVSPKRAAADTARDPDPRRGAADRREPVSASSLADKLRVAAMGSRGASRQDWTIGDFIDEVSGDDRDLDQALRTVNGVELATTDHFEVRESVEPGRRPIDIGEMTKHEVGETSVKEGPQVTPIAAVKFEPGAGSTSPEALEKGQADALRTQVKRQIGQVRTCYESQLNQDPTLSGRMVLSWMISGGHAFDVRVEESNIRSEALTACVIGRVKGWTFDRDLDTEVRYPFVFEPAS